MFSSFSGTISLCGKILYNKRFHLSLALFRYAERYYIIKCFLFLSHNFATRKFSPFSCTISLRGKKLYNKRFLLSRNISIRGKIENKRFLLSLGLYRYAERYYIINVVNDRHTKMLLGMAMSF